MRILVADDDRSLVARLRALLRRGGGERPVVLAAGDLRLDPRRTGPGGVSHRSS
ncbi:response regulator [Frankia sp. CcI6]|uniref:response regulator n=1 Tax=Frankia sp. CcI6 TaxID=1352929 RepID=UPI00031DA04E|nr:MULTISPECIES: response regulator [Frankia]